MQNAAFFAGVAGSGGMRGYGAYPGMAQEVGQCATCLICRLSYTVIMKTKTFADVLTSVLKVQDKTAYRLAKDAGLNPSFVGRLLSGEQAPSFETACKLADALGMTTEGLRAENYFQKK